MGANRRWTMTCKVLDKDAAAKVDTAWKDAVQRIWRKIPGVIGIERAIGKDMNYVVTVQFEHQHALDNFLASDIMQQELSSQMEQQSHLFVGGIDGVHWQIFTVEQFL